LLENANEQEWRNNHAAYHDTHSVLLFFVLSVVLIYLLYKLYTYMRQRAAIWFRKREVPDTPGEVSYTTGQADKCGTVNINIHIAM